MQKIFDIQSSAYCLPIQVRGTLVYAHTEGERKVIPTFILLTVEAILRNKISYW